MNKYLELKDARCKDCYKCLRGCPVKAIEYENQKARIIMDRCILCGNCTLICPQNAKFVHSNIDDVLDMIKSDVPVYVTVAPAAISSFGVKSFESIANALKELGFTDAFETAIGAEAVTKKYEELLLKGDYDNFITSACPAVNTMIELYFPKALPSLARVDSPMLAHAKILRKQFGENIRVVFIGPCIAKKREGAESDVVDCVLTFEELEKMIEDNGITLDKKQGASGTEKIKARCYPISRGIIKSFKNPYPEKYEFLAVDGVHKCMEVLENIESYHGMFLELNACEYACVNGPCALTQKGGALKANADIRHYTNDANASKEYAKEVEVDISKIYSKRANSARDVSNEEIENILRQTGKRSREDELDCGACGYNTCREKAWAVANGFAEIDMCLPYMRTRAESMSYEIIRNSPNGIAVVDFDYKVVEMNQKVMELWGIKNFEVGTDLVNYTDPTPMIQALSTNQNLVKRKIKIAKTGRYVEMSVTLMREHKVMFCTLRDITSSVEASDRLNSVKLETLQTTDEVIKKQMRVAQEIASLLGETTAETKVALLKLKTTLKDSEGEGE